MRRSLTIAKRILLELIKDKRTLALVIIAPVFILFLVHLAFNSNQTTDVKIGTVNMNHQVVSNMSDMKHVNVNRYSGINNAKKKLHDQKLDGILYHHDQKIDAIYSNTDPSKTTMIKNILQGATTKYTLTILGKTIKKISLANITMQNKLMNQQQATILKNNPKMAQKIKQQTPKINNQSISNPTVHNHYIYGDSNSTYFNKIIPVLIGFFVFMFVFLISGISLLKERTSGTLDRMLATPVKRSEIIFGYMISYGILAIVQSIVIVFFAIWVMNVQVVGSIFSMIIINVLLALVALTIGLLLSTLTTSDFQMMQFIPVIVVPQLLFSGLVSLDSMGKWVQDITYIFPLRYAGDALNGIVMSGESLGHFGGDIIALLIFIIIFTVANVLSLKRYRKV